MTNKAVLISIRPKWCELIASGKKTVEIRKTHPKIETPFKCYIYCTKDHGNEGSATHFFESEDGTFTSAGKTYAAFLSGTVIGEFVCDQIEKIGVAFRGGDGPLVARGGNEVWKDGMLEYMSCLSTDDICRYIGGVGGTGYGWHISNLVIYDKPKQLSEFMKPCEPDEDGIYLCAQCKRLGENYGCGGTILRPPQSWCYVEVLE